MRRDVNWPAGAKFAFTIFDDTDNSTVTNTKPVYDYLYEKRILTTKSVWCFPPRGDYGGQSLQEPDYLKWVENLQSQGFEIGLHNVGDGVFTRDEIIRGLKEFEQKIGNAPKIHCNHVSNPDNLYWWDRRFVWPFSALYRFAYWLKKRSPVPAGGDNPTSELFWGDVAQKKIKYVRNLTFCQINTLACDPRMPWGDPNKPYVNFWFSSSDGHNVNLFNDLLAPGNLDKLEKERGACIVYTHFASGFVDDYGRLDPKFKRRIDDLSSRGGWFVPCGELLDYLQAQEGRVKAGYWYRLSKNLIWAFGRVRKYVRYRM